jgi:hypothetical protein
MNKDVLLGSYKIPFHPFLGLDLVFDKFAHEEFQKLPPRKKFKKVNKALLDLIEQAQEPCFLLPAVIDFIDRVNQEKLLKEPYKMVLFEFWLNHFSHLTPEENMRVRSKIVGKLIPREEYQLHFPIGMGKQFAGTHFVVAHLSPDVDTTIASFWGWVDAFAAKVGSGTHQWCLPAKVTDTHLALLFEELFSKGVFSVVPRETPSLTMTALDLVTKKDVIKLPASTKSSSIDHSNHAGKPVLLVNEDGHLRGDWRANDAEVARQVVLLFMSTMRWFESMIHENLIVTLTKEDVHLPDIQRSQDALFAIQIKMSDPVKEATDRQKKYQNDFLKKVLSAHLGINSSFAELILALDKTTGSDFTAIQTLIETLDDPDFFERTKLFSFVQRVFKSLKEAINVVRSYVDRMDLLLQVKVEVLALPSHFITLKSDVEEIRTKMDNLDYLTVVIPEEEHSWFPVGVIYANDVKKQTLGTVSTCDFSNEEEMKMASYLEIISVVDHHKSNIRTESPACLLIADTQSANTLMAELAMQMNERYSVMGISEESLEKGLERLQKNALSEHIQLLKLKCNFQNNKRASYFIHKDREFSEYLCFLCAILDDTDLLTKVSARDVECVARLLNKMKSIACQRNCEIISLTDIPRDTSFAKNAATRILQNQDMYSIYKKSYEFKEREVEENLAACIAGEPSFIFADTKEQNGCCRVGQTKLFYTNIPLFARYADDLRKIWFKGAQKTLAEKPHIDFHMHMISTILGAEEVYNGQTGNWHHHDELWIWTAPTQLGAERLVHFLNTFQASAVAVNNPMTVEFPGPNFLELAQIFSQNFPKVGLQKQQPSEDTSQGLPIAILRFKPGILNSRKALITPYLPRFIA